MNEPHEISRSSITLSGTSLSPGLAQGPMFVHRDVLERLDEYYDIEAHHVEEECNRVEKAIEQIAEDLKRLAKRVEQEMDGNLSGVFEAHRSIVSDPTLKNEVRKEISEEWVSAGRAVRRVFRRWERRVRSMEAEISKQKAEDLVDLCRRLVTALAGIRAHALEDLPAESVLVAKRLLPSDTVFLARRSAAAVLLEVGGPGSHAALFAREIGLPCIAHLPDIMDRTPPSALALVDADQGKVIINPRAEQKSKFQQKLDYRTHLLSRARQHAHENAVTMDEKHIPVLANIGCRNDTDRAVDNGADGVGLYRIEQIYLALQTPPNTEELFEHMYRTLEPAEGKVVCIRLLDVGADKRLPFINTAPGLNPSLGRRGIRLLRDYPDLLKTQLSALLRLTAHFDVRILVPMVTLPRDMALVRELLVQTALDQGVSPPPQLGAMIETPAAALSGRRLAQHADFFSVGTNDLTQYVFAADRELANVDEYYNDAHDVIFRLIGNLHDDNPQIPLAVCGELAGRKEHTSRLLNSGVRLLSVAPPLIPEVKEKIRQCTIHETKPMEGTI